MKIQKGKTQFLMGIDKEDQLRNWMVQNQAPGVAFVGRSNVGKSSLINAFFGSKVARVSKTPGRTRQVNIFSFQVLNEKDNTEKTFYLYDLPGYGHAEVSKEMLQNWQILIDTFFEMSSLRTLLLNIQDARHPLQSSDLMFQKYLKAFNLETYLILNKVDKLKTQKERFAMNKKMPTLLKDFKWVKHIFFASAEKKEGLEAIEDSIINYLIAR